MGKFFLVVYYVIINNLPHSRYLKWSNSIRLWYLKKILKIIPEITPLARFENSVYISDGKNVSIGKNCQINENVFIQGARIGNDVLIAPNVAILCSKHHYKSPDIPIIQQGEEWDLFPVIGNDVWIGRNAIILPGVRIGDGAVVAAGAVVSRNVAPFAVVAGVPAEKINERTHEN
ncbi:acyltransferase [Emcibacter sp.]|uniref:acyltransferase n=1 Tax=Emcibacter sp. TaxID=1979954 RepID=UPI003B6413C0